MKKRLLIFGIFSVFFACEETENQNSLDQFCEAAPTGWECKIIQEDFDLSDIPKSLNDPLAIVKYEYPFEEITTIGESVIAPSLILNLYSIELKDKLIKQVISQQIFSWCIPILYGETEDYIVITSPCFINKGTFTEDANGKIEALHSSLEKLLVQSYYNQE